MARLDTYLAFAFGTCFCAVLLFLAVVIPEPSKNTAFIFRVVLSVAAGGVGAVIPGMLKIRLPYVRAGGAFALAVMVYSFNPPALL
ncbi:hypothetical protein AWB68_04264 [Caballeronia choica]|uniref:Uncharacterized protein n=1 Tax=Caballeronia choica TaxID=326476 RepID=A0A158JU91_9BURK|nr:hypothetical protein AWB68_04264 [Caballeronia choica]